MKTGHDALDTVENECVIPKHANGKGRPRYRRKRVRVRKTSKRDPTPLLPLKTSPGAQDMKTVTDALGTSKTSTGSQNMKTGHDTLGTTENE
jgi:hypothetical protein